MQSLTQTVPISKKMLWAGRIISALAILFLTFDGVIKANPSLDRFGGELARFEFLLNQQ